MDHDRPRSRTHLAPRHEAEAFLDALQSAPPNAVTACRGWTTHEIIAHLTSGAEGLANQIEAHLADEPVPEFGTWEQREPPLRALDDANLRRRLASSEQRMASAFDALLASVGPEGVVPEVGFGFPAGELVLHMRQEFAVHRWDLVGDDADGTALLAQRDLLQHCVTMLGDPLLDLGLKRDPAPHEPLQARLRCRGEPDLIISVRDGRGSLMLAAPDGDEGDPLIETDAAARLLLVWGRRPSDSRRMRSSLPAATLLRLQTILAGF